MDFLDEADVALRRYLPKHIRRDGRIRLGAFQFDSPSEEIAFDNVSIDGQSKTTLTQCKQKGGPSMACVQACYGVLGLIVRDIHESDIPLRAAWTPLEEDPDHASVINPERPTLEDEAAARQFLADCADILLPSPGCAH